MSDIEKQPTEAERLKEALRQKNGQTERTDHLIAEIVLKLVDEVAELKKRSIRTVVKIKN